MAGQSGQFYTLAAGIQSAKGTPQTTPAYKLRLTGGAVIPEPQIIDLPETDSSIQRSKSAKVGQMIGGAIEGFIRSDEMGFLSYAHLGATSPTGAGPYAHTATAAAQQPYLTLYSAYNSTTLVDRYVDCRITEFTLRGTGGQALSYSAGFMGLTSTYGETDPVLSPSSVDPLTYPDITVTLNSVTTDIVESFEVTSVRNSEVIYGDTGMSASEVGTGRWSVTGSLTILFESDAKWRSWLANSAAGTTTSPVIYTEDLSIAAVRTASSDEVNINMTAVELRAVGLEPDPAGNVLRMTYEFAAEPQSAIANTFNIVCDNNVASY